MKDKQEILREIKLDNNYTVIHRQLERNGNKFWTLIEGEYHIEDEMYLHANVSYECRSFEDCLNEYANQTAYRYMVDGQKDIAVSTFRALKDNMNYILETIE